ncbi:MAG: helix-turn-helix domain-containing protein [Nitrososphaeraceae archaeon]|jgi:DNA-binding HxlR family transcriptional regulator
METISKRKEKELPVLNKNLECNFEGYDSILLMSETAKLRSLITKRGTLEILIPLCCTTDPVRHKQFRHALKGFSTRTLSIRLKELEKSGILERHRYNEIPPRVEYTLTTKGQELVESVVSILQWMRKWANSKKR